jgi:hypothetical protein
MRFREVSLAQQDIAQIGELFHVRLSVLLEPQETLSERRESLGEVPFGEGDLVALCSTGTQAPQVAAPLELPLSCHAECQRSRQLVPITGEPTSVEEDCP